MRSRFRATRWIQIAPGSSGRSNLATKGEIWKVLVHEVSGVARRNSTSHRFVEDLEALGVSLYWHAQRIETLCHPAAGIRRPRSCFRCWPRWRGTNARRWSSGSCRVWAKPAGKVTAWGGPPGSVVEREEFLGKHRDIVRQLKAGHSIRNTAKITGKGVSTVQRVKAGLEACGRIPTVAG